MRTDKVAILIKKAALEFEKISNPILLEYDLTASQYRVLKFLYAQPERAARQADLEKYYSLTHPTTIGLLKTLETKGFVMRAPNPQDARSRIVSLTDKAIALQGKLENLGDNLDERLTEKLTLEEKKRLVFLLQKLLGIKE